MLHAERARCRMGRTAVALVSRRQEEREALEREQARAKRLAEATASVRGDFLFGPPPPKYSCLVQVCQGAWRDMLGHPAVVVDCDRGAYLPVAHVPLQLAPKVERDWGRACGPTASFRESDTGELQSKLWHAMGLEVDRAPDAAVGRVVGTHKGRSGPGTAEFVNFSMVQITS